MTRGGRVAARRRGGHRGYGVVMAGGEDLAGAGVRVRDPGREGGGLRMGWAGGYEVVMAGTRGTGW
ncbi:hypothetical protein OHT76_22265 [Streptomyces sp. NBC_00287]|uniref:hypothetical protein n=1 Tax=Streptomyces sp. NBC_00287 TaxID=2975702 RepID=UPI002E2D2037|nr:hypothetical protein [Streptomyces sp. NBC_00287]